MLLAQSCLTLCNPMDCSLPGSLSMEFSRQEYWSGLPFPSPEDLPDPEIKPWSPALFSSVQFSRSVVSDFATPWTEAHQALQSMGFSRQEYWSGLPFPSLGDLPDPGTKPGSPTLWAVSLPSEPPGKPGAFSTSQSPPELFPNFH